MAHVRVFHGPHRSARRDAVNRVLLDHWGRALLIVPTGAYAEQRTEEIADFAGLPGVWGRPVLTFQDFVADLLRGTDYEYVRIDAVEQRILMERAVSRLHGSEALRSLGPAAQTPGFVTHAQRVVAQLKQAAIAPETFRERVAGRPGASAVDAVMAELYGAYQEALREAGAYDLQGMYWMADLLCRDGAFAGLAEIDVLLLDAFDDFTPSEFRLLRSLEPHVEQLVFGLNFDTNPSRGDLYAIARDTHESIVRTFDAVVESFDEEPPATFTGFASSNLFWRDKPGEPSGLDPNIELQACHDLVHEVESLGRRIKTLIVEDGVPPDRIAVVSRDLSAMAGVLRDVFAEFGIPAGTAPPRSLSESSAAAFLLRFFEAVDGWPREAVLDVVTAPWFAPPEEKAGDENDAYAGLFPLLARTARIVFGYGEWSDGLRRLDGRLAEGSGEEMEDLLRRFPDVREGCGALLARVGVLHALQERIPVEATEGIFAEGLDALVDALGIPGAVARTEIVGIRAFEEEALGALRSLLATAWHWGTRDSRTLPRDAFLAGLRQAFKMTEVTVRERGPGVACLDLEGIRHRHFDHVFLAGMNEGDVPRPLPPNAIYSEADLEGLREAGIGLEDAGTRANRELLLFHRVFDVPRKTLTVSWHVVDGKGKERAPSPFVQDLRELFPALETWEPRNQAEALVPGLADVACRRDLRNAVFLGDFPQEFLGVDFEAARAAAAIEGVRHDASPFGVYDAVFHRSDLVDTVANRFGEGHCFSVNQLETYANCPFRFFVERVLGMDGMEAPDEAFDPRVRGIILHDALEAFHRRYAGRAVADIPAEEAGKALHAIAVETFDRLAWRSTSAPRGVVEVEGARIHAVLQRYLHIEGGRAETQWKPTHFEVAFGPVRGESEVKDSLSRPEPYVMKLDGGPVLFAGRIDRVDRTEDAVRIVDYKTTVSVRQKDIDEGRSLQLTVYALAMQEFLLPELPCEEAHFMAVGRKDSVEGLRGGRKKDEKWEERQATARRVIGDSVAGIREGRFPPTPGEKSCTYCPAKGVCRYEPARVERKAGP